MADRKYEAREREGRARLRIEVPYGTSSQCPACGSAGVARILMGLVHSDERLQKEIEEKKVILGGCIMTGDDPDYFCNDCKHRWRDESKHGKLATAK